MIRKNFFITEAQGKWLGKVAYKSELSEAEFLRRILDWVIERNDLLDEIKYRRNTDENQS
jgi:hypothetical protein